MNKKQKTLLIALLVTGNFVIAGYFYLRLKRKEKS